MSLGTTLILVFKMHVPGISLNEPEHVILELMIAQALH